VTSISSEDRFKKFSKTYLPEVHNKLGMTAGTNKPNEGYAHNMGFSAMLAEEYILIDISLSATSWCDFSSQHQ